MKKRLGLSLLATLSVATGTALVSRAQNGDADLEQVQQYMKVGDLRAARVALLNAAKANPKSGDVQVELAEVSLELFDAPAAQAALERAVALGVSEREIAHLLAHSLWMQGELVEAESRLLETRVSDRHRGYALRILARVQMDKGDLDAAQASFDEALRLAPEDSLIWTDLARLRFVLADQKGAIEAVDHALKLNANNVRAIEFRGRLMRSQFGVVAALPWFERGLQIRATDIPLLEEYGLTLGEAGRYRDMLAQARKIITLDRNNPKAYYMQAVLAARAGNYALAKRILPRAGSDFLELPAPMLLDGICEYELGNYNRAVDRFQQLLAIQPRNRRVRTLLAQAMYRAGDPLDALDTIREIASRGDADSYSLTVTARSFAASGQTARATPPLDDAAMAAFRPALALPEPVSLVGAADAARRTPDDARAVLPYIRLLLAAGDSNAALAEAVRLQKANGGVAEAHLLVGDIEMERANIPDALAAFQAARQIRFTEPVMLRLVDAMSRAGNEAGADEALNAYLAYNPASPTALRLAGFRALDAQRWQDAVILLERVRAKLGNNDSILLANLARARAGLGQHEAAARDAALAYRVAPMNVMVVRVYADVLKKLRKRPKAAREMAAKAAAMSVQRQ
ncbi:MAG: tetratricopeptide repeat protein [Sphingomonadaceae bacterium]|nr:tetratricopeptide repeat protein [Sphingomonadaceae bacterium]